MSYSMEKQESIKLRMFCVESALEYYKIKGGVVSFRDISEMADRFWEWILNK